MTGKRKANRKRNRRGFGSHRISDEETDSQDDEYQDVDDIDEEDVTRTKKKKPEDCSEQEREKMKTTISSQMGLPPPLLFTILQCSKNLEVTLICKTWRNLIRKYTSYMKILGEANSALVPKVARLYKNLRSFVYDGNLLCNSFYSVVISCNHLKNLKASLWTSCLSSVGLLPKNSGHNITSLSLRANQEQFQFLLNTKFFPNLVQLNLEAESRTFDSLPKQLMALPSLKELNVSIQIQTSTVFSSKVIPLLSKLTGLCLEGYNKVGINKFAKFFPYLSNLRLLHISNTSNTLKTIEDVSTYLPSLEMLHMEKIQLIGLESNFKFIRSLILMNCGLSTAKLQQICQDYHFIQTLVIGSFKDLDVSSINQLKYLQHLALLGPGTISVEVLSSICSSCTYLKEIAIMSPLTKQSVELLMSKTIKFIEFLKPDGTYYVSDKEWIPLWSIYCGEDAYYGHFLKPVYYYKYFVI